MTVSVTVLYPPPSLSASRVLQDLTRHRHSRPTSSLKWLKLQDQDAESCETDVRFAPPSHNPPATCTTHNEQHHHSTTSRHTFDPSSRTIWNSNTVSFDLTHSVAQIRHAPSAYSRYHPAGFWRPGTSENEDCEESIAEYPDYEELEESSVIRRLDVQSSRKRKRRSPNKGQHTISDDNHAAATENIARVRSISGRSERFDLDADDEDSNSAPVPPKGHFRPLGITSTMNTSNKSKSASRLGDQVAFPGGLHIRHRPQATIDERVLPSETTLHDVTNITYGGAVDSQSQQVGSMNGRADRYHDVPQRDISTLSGQQEQETQFSMPNDSAPPATYESMPVATGTYKSRADAKEFGEYDLPIINVSSLVHLDDITPHGDSVDLRAGPINDNVDLLAVIFEVGESKDIPVKTFRRGAAGQAQPNTNRLCSLKICQPRRDGQNGIAMMEVTLWGKLAERTESAKHRFVKGDVIWFKSE
ncbi:hypothetical protein QFC21_006823 [Naganishia friedmannii]|uniref:Uncharacterized protein n=1 Tax=Naganishia friedmannii TaxID=89922 RepID=A0ACC2V161_9TREE|nr:hypothetical protein QFC21_006823 [Naganishia friedmannii]